MILVAAVGKNREIGEGNRLLWNLPADLRHFRALTAGKPVLMGRKTFESIGRLLPDRKNIILSQNPDYRILGAEVVHSFEAAVHLARNFSREVFVIGGEQIYRLAMPHAAQLVITHVDAAFPQADAFFPQIDPDTWQVAEQTHHPADAENEYAFDIVRYERK
jgi:Dihydrofolate reductase